MDDSDYPTRLCRITGDQGYNESHDFLWCNATWDTASCWPQTLTNVTAVIHCPRNILGVDPRKNATRFCYPNATWEDKADYSSCFHDDPIHHQENQQVARSNLIINIIYHFGFCVSTIALLVALGIFLGFRNLRCLRNKIHCHLIMSFILRNTIWITMQHSVENAIVYKPHLMWLCKALVTAFNYFQSTNFFWMFVEGLHLHMIVVWTYSSERLRLWHFILIGWGTPTVFVLTWAAIKAKYDNNHCWTNVKESKYDYIHCVPIFLILFANVIFFFSIIWILITKLRMTNTPEAVDYRKAVKGAVVLLPLLGITYIVFLLHPEPGTGYADVLIYTDIILQSFQGLLVALFYCFLNCEVRHTILTKLNKRTSEPRFQNRSATSRCSRISTVSVQRHIVSPTLSGSNMHQELLTPEYRGNYDLTPSSSIGDRSLTLFSDSDADNDTCYTQVSFGDTHI